MVQLTICFWICICSERILLRMYCTGLRWLHLAGISTSSKYFRSGLGQWCRVSGKATFLTSIANFTKLLVLPDPEQETRFLLLCIKSLLNLWRGTSDVTVAIQHRNLEWFTSWTKLTCKFSFMVKWRGLVQVALFHSSHLFSCSLYQTFPKDSRLFQVPKTNLNSSSGGGGSEKVCTSYAPFCQATIPEDRKILPQYRNSLQIQQTVRANVAFQCNKSYIFISAFLLIPHQFACLWFSPKEPKQ